MRRVFNVSASLIFLSAFAFAESWTGSLVDASCADQQKNAACAPTSSTTSYAVQANGKTMKFDAAGNKKAADAMKSHESGANRSKEPNAPPAAVVVTVTGTAEGDTVKVETVQVQ